MLVCEDNHKFALHPQDSVDRGTVISQQRSPAFFGIQYKIAILV